MYKIVPKSRKWHNKCRVHGQVINGVLGYYVSQWGAGRTNSGGTGRRNRFYQGRYGQRPRGRK